MRMRRQRATRLGHLRLARRRSGSGAAAVLHVFIVAKAPFDEAAALLVLTGQPGLAFLLGDQDHARVAEGAHKTTRSPSEHGFQVVLPIDVVVFAHGSLREPSAAAQPGRALSAHVGPCYRRRACRARSTAESPAYLVDG